jgi:hypothetical protein
MSFLFNLVLHAFKKNHGNLHKDNGFQDNTDD